MAQIIFYVNGVQAYSGKVGDQLNFDVPGYSQIWITQYQNGVVQYDGPEQVPSVAQLLTSSDVGVFQGYGYEIINGQKGQQIASWTFQVVAPTGTTAPATPPTAAQPPGTNCATGLCTASPPPAPPPQTTTVIPVPIATPGGGTTDSGTTTPSAGGLSPFGDLPGSIPVATTGTGSPTTGAGGPTPAPAPSTAAFDIQGFIKSPLFWLLLILVALAYFLAD